MARALQFIANLALLFTQYESLIDRFGAAKSVGFRAVELMFPYDYSIEQLVETKNRTGLDIVLFNAWPGNRTAGDLGLAGIPGREADFLASLNITFAYAEALDVKKLHIMSGISPGIENSPEVISTLINNLRAALPELEARNVVALLEPINKVTAPGYVLSDYDVALSVIKAVNSSHVRLQLDTFHLQQIHGDLTQRILSSKDYIGHVQIAQVPHRHEPHIPGEIDHNYLFDLLELIEWKDWIGLEYVPKNDTYSGLQEWLALYNCEL